mmetsp:Transcript_20797/g.48629  ORF Transcript_20797/g.48629 Transcript_20797/m.48629 type:complete len:128 (-) Transcript_20797:1328-1711(-)
MFLGSAQSVPGDQSSRRSGHLFETLGIVSLTRMVMLLRRHTLGCELPCPGQDCAEILDNCRDITVPFESKDACLTKWFVEACGQLRVDCLEQVDSGEICLEKLLLQQVPVPLARGETSATGKEWGSS